MPLTPGPPAPAAADELAHLRQLLELNRPELAETLARQRLATYPHEPEIQLVLSCALMRLGRYPEALAVAEVAISLDPESVVAHHYRAYNLAQLGQLASAIEANREVLRLGPHSRYFGDQADWLYQLRRYPEAVAAASTGLQLNARAEHCLMWRALALEMLGQPALADADFKAALEIAPADAWVYDSWGRTLLRRYQPAAAPLLAEAMRLKPDWADQLAPLLQQIQRWAGWPRWLASQQAKYQADLAAKQGG